MKNFPTLPLICAGVASIVLAANPSVAADLSRWKFDASQNSLEFTTDEGVKPQAQLLAAPNKLVILLPNTQYRQPTARQAGANGIREVRVGYNTETAATSIVFELEPGFAFDPQQVLIKAQNTDRQWLVQLPPPQPETNFPSSNLTGNIPVYDAQNQVVTATPVVAAAVDSVATLERVDFDPLYNRVVFRGDRPLAPVGNWVASTGTYELLFRNTRLGVNFRLPTNSAVELRALTSANDTVKISVRRRDGRPITTWQPYFGGTVIAINLGPPVAPPIATTPSLPPTLPPRTTTPPRTLPPVATNPTRPSGIPPKQGDGDFPRINRRVLVVIDPGHGGRDPGAISPINRLEEVQVVTPIARRVAAILQERGVAVRMTRNDDVYVGLDERVSFARSVGANIFVSIHANSINGRPDVNGLETYHHYTGRTLAEIVHRNILGRVPQSGFYLNDRGVRAARFLVLRKSNIPAILIETGYLTSEAEVARLSRSDYREVMAEGIARGILEYLQRSE